MLKIIQISCHFKIIFSWACHLLQATYFNGEIFLQNLVLLPFSIPAVQSVKNLQVVLSLLQLVFRNIIQINEYLFYFDRWKRNCTKKDIPKMGQLSPHSCQLQDKWSLCWPSWWQDADQAAGSLVRGKTGMFIWHGYLSSEIVSTDHC